MTNGLTWVSNLNTEMFQYIKQTLIKNKESIDTKNKMNDLFIFISYNRIYLANKYMVIREKKVYPVPPRALLSNKPIEMQQEINSAITIVLNCFLSNCSIPALSNGDKK